MHYEHIKQSVTVMKRLVTTYQLVAQERKCCQGSLRQWQGKRRTSGAPKAGATPEAGAEAGAGEAAAAADMASAAPAAAALAASASRALASSFSRCSAAACSAIARASSTSDLQQHDFVHHESLSVLCLLMPPASSTQQPFFHSSAAPNVNTGILSGGWLSLLRTLEEAQALTTLSLGPPGHAGQLPGAGSRAGGYPARAAGQSCPQTPASAAARGK